MKLLALLTASSAVVSIHAEIVAASTPSGRIMAEAGTPPGGRCEPAGEINPDTGLYCPGQKEVDDLASAYNTWFESSDIGEFKGLWQEGDATQQCMFPDGCTTGTDNIAEFFSGFRPMLAKFRYEPVDMWEAGPGVLHFPLVHEYLENPNGCGYDTYYRRVSYYNVEGKMTQSHLIIQPQAEFSAYLGVMFSDTVCEEPFSWRSE